MFWGASEASADQPKSKGCKKKFVEEKTSPHSSPDGSIFLSSFWDSREAGNPKKASADSGWFPRRRNVLTCFKEFTLLLRKWWLKTVRTTALNA